MNTIIAGSKKCSYCGEDMGANARRCPYCGSLADVKTSGSEIQNELLLDNAESASFKESDSLNENTSVSENAYFIEEEAESSSIPQEVHPVESYGTDEYAAHGINVGEAASVTKSINGGLSNGLKVFLTVISAVLPGIGQLIGIIAAIVFINSDDSSDKRSFGAALLIASLIMFTLTCLFFFIIIIALSSIA